MALKVHKVVVVGCPRSIFDGQENNGGVGKSCFCNRFVRPDCFSMHHSSIMRESEWRDNPIYNEDHFIYWGAATKRLHDGTRARFQVVEQTEFYNSQNNEPFPADNDYIMRATATHFISRGKIANRLHQEEEYAIPSSLKHNVSARATQLFPNNEFSEGKGALNFICLFDPTLEDHSMEIQLAYLTRLLKEIVKTKCKVVLACAKCDAAKKENISLGAQFAATGIHKKPIAFIETSATEGVNIEEVFLCLIGSKKKKNFVRTNSPIVAAPSYNDVVRSRSQNENFAMANFNQLLKETVNSFSMEWSDVWPLLQAKPNCSAAVEVLGIDKARKVFCQRLMELKVKELRAQNRQQKSQNFQNELFKAFSNHPDFGTDDSMYDFVYSPTPSSATYVPTPTKDSSSNFEIPLTPVQTPNPSSTVPLPIPLSLKSPPPPPPTSSIPSLSSDQFKTLSPPRQQQVFDHETTPILNRNHSLELLDKIQTLPSRKSRTSSLRYRNRTLPPLPSSGDEEGSPLRRISNTSLARSNPHLADTDMPDGSASLDRQRKLSNSMDCLDSGSLYNKEEEEEEHDEDASPYLQPVELLKSMGREFHGKSYASMRVGKPKSRNPLVTMGDNQQLRRSKSFKDKSSRKQYGHTVNRAISESPPPAPPPPQRPPLPTHKTSPLIQGVSIHSLEMGESSLDFSLQPTELNNGDIADDNISIKSGPFAEIEENVNPDSLSESSYSRDSYYSKSHTPDSYSNYSRGIPPGATSSSLLLPPPASLHLARSHNSLEKENLYARIPADEEYLTMRSGVSFEELLEGTRSNKSSRSTLSAAQDIIKKLRDATRTTTTSLDVPTTSNVSPLLGRSVTTTNVGGSPYKRGSEPIIVTPSFEAMQRRHTSLQTSNYRPLPPSPTKMRKLSAALRRKNSGGGGGGSNIYESIDENEDWFQKLKRRNQQQRNMKDLVSQCDAIMEIFWKAPQVQEQFIAAVNAILPHRTLPHIDTSIPPFYINPDYFMIHDDDMGHQIGNKMQQQDEVCPIDKVLPAEEDGCSSIAEEVDNIEGEIMTISDEAAGNVPPHRKLAVTDSILMKMNRSLQRDSSSSSSSSDDSTGDEEEEDDDGDDGHQYDIEYDIDVDDESDEDSNNNEDDNEDDNDYDSEWQNSDTLKNESSLTIIHQQKDNRHDNDDNDDEYLVLNNFKGSIKPMKVGSNHSGLDISNDMNISHPVITTTSTAATSTTAIDDDSLTHRHANHYQSNLPPDYGHLRICQLNSLDSGISASNGISE